MRSEQDLSYLTVPELLLEDARRYAYQSFVREAFQPWALEFCGPKCEARVLPMRNEGHVSNLTIAHQSMDLDGTSKDPTSLPARGE